MGILCIEEKVNKDQIKIKLNIKIIIYKIWNPVMKNSKKIKKKRK